MYLVAYVQIRICWTITGPQTELPHVYVFYPKVQLKNIPIFNIKQNSKLVETTPPTAAAMSGRNGLRRSLLAYC